MATFESTQSMRNQHHFEVLEIDLPVITGACTIGESQGTGTPLTCDQKWAIADGGLSEYKTYYFTNENAPLLPSINGEPIWRCIKSISETATELKPGDGLSSRSSLSVIFNDFNKQDPNIGASGVTDIVKNQGTYFGKLNIRQIFENKNVRLKLYRVESNGSIDLVGGAQIRSYLADTLSLSKDGSWKLACKDVLSLVNIGEKSWPIPQGGYIRNNINSSTTTIPVDLDTTYAANDFLRVGDEFMQVVSYNNTNPSAPTITVAVRGGDLYAPTSAVLLTKTTASSHSAGDEIFICDLSDDETIDSLLTRILVESDLPVALIPSADWAAEVAEWHANDKINTLHSNSEDVNDVINRILTGYLMDLWFEPVSSTGFTEGQVKLSAISVWKQSTATLSEGKEINAHSIKKKAKEALRASRALVLYDKRNLAETNNTTSFKKASQFSDNTLIGADLFTKHKDKIFDNNFILDKDAAVLLTQRYVSRFKYTPFERSWVTDERYLTFKVGDVVDLHTSVDQSIYGDQGGSIRSQITKINPKYKDGRTYEVKAITYEAAFNAGSEIIIDEPSGTINLYNDFAGAPSEPVDLTFIFDGSYSHSANGGTAIRAGSFASGSTLTVILVNGFDGQAAGGEGGDSDQDGTIGGIVFDAQGVTTDIYFSGSTPSAAYPTADGYIRAPGGGGGGGATEPSFDAFTPNSPGGGGGGGAGRLVGIGGIPIGSSPAQAGTNGDILGNGGIGGDGSAHPASYNDGGNGGDWGVGGIKGVDVTLYDPEGFITYFGAGGAGGLAGSGIVDGGGTVTLYGSTALRYINGNGDH